MKSIFKRKKAVRQTAATPKRQKTVSTESLDFGFLDGVLTGLLSRSETFGVLQIGANDGVTVDPVRSFLMRNREAVGAVLVEPLPDVFEVLSKNYAEHPQVRLLNGAVGTSGPLTLYRIKSQFADKYTGVIATGITSVDRDFVLRKSKNITGIDSVPLEDRIEPVVAPGYTVTEIVIKNKDLIGLEPFVQIDAEGFDDEVIRSIDFKKIKPIAISYESNKLGNERREALHTLLKNEGYRILPWSDNEDLALA